jgi:DNA-binding MurR/RpiR family transcriptional regulator
MAKQPKSNHLKYYFGVKLIDGSTIVTTSARKLAEFIGVSRVTVSRYLSKSQYRSTQDYIMGVSDLLVRQDKGDRRQFRRNVANYQELIDKAQEYYQLKK